MGDTASGYDGRGADRKRVAGMDGRLWDIERDATVEPSVDSVRVGDNTWGEHEAYDVHRAFAGGANGM